MINVDFQKEVFSEEVESNNKEVLYCNSQSLIYSDSQNGCHVRNIVEPESISLAKIIKKQSAAETPTPEALLKHLTSALASQRQKVLKDFLLTKFLSVDKTAFAKHLSQNQSLAQTFAILNQLFAYLANTTFTD